MFKSLHALGRVKSGFEPRRVLTAQISVPRRRYIDEELERKFSPLANARAARFFEAAVEQIRSVPGVTAVGAVSGLPLMGEVWGKTVTLYDRPLPSTIGELPPIQYRVVAGDYFRALGIPIVGGRDFTPADAEQGAKVAIVNEEMARRYWKGADPVGKVISVNPPIQLMPAGTAPPDYKPDLLNVIGVAGDVHYGALSASPSPLLYAPFAQGSEGTTTMFVVVRAQQDPLGV